MRGLGAELRACRAAERACASGAGRGGLLGACPAPFRAGLRGQRAERFTRALSLRVPARGLAPGTSNAASPAAPSPLSGALRPAALSRGRQRPFLSSLGVSNVEFTPGGRTPPRDRSRVCARNRSL